jgi:glycosyltransferase involved in cell wall biosynthesis
MKIAIVAPSPVPFGIGGAEKLWWGLLEFINKHTSHQCELIKIPTKETSFGELIDSYHAFYKLDLSYFDMVITTKYPAWMIQHSNHHIYMQHCLRGLYDTYHFTGLPLKCTSEHPAINDLLQLLKYENMRVEDVFDALYQLKTDKSVPKEAFSFPGPFIRQVLHYFDSQAMRNVTKFSAISQTVINRKEYFPKNCCVNKIHHPSNLDNFKNSSYTYFFTVSRLDDAKRIQMIIEAYLNSSTQIPLKIAGTGPLLDRFK